jgi:hypothetical protein
LIFVAIDKAWRVSLMAEIELDLPKERAWEAMKDVSRFVSYDPFHTRVYAADGNAIALGSEIVIMHGFLGVGFKRRGRLLRWREGRGYAMSDLSARDARSGFPHIYSYRLDSLAPDRCRLSVSVRGRWTLRWIGRPVARFWLTAVGWLIELSLRQRLSQM